LTIKEDDSSESEDQNDGEVESQNDQHKEEGKK